MDGDFPWKALDFRLVGCALCHRKDDRPLMYTLPPMDYPGMRDSRIDIRLHGECNAFLTNLIGATLYTGLVGSGIWNPGDHFTFTPPNNVQS